MNCKNCNSPIKKGNAFCPNCGTAVEEKKEEVTKTVEAAVTPKKSKAPLIIGIIIGSVLLLTIIIVVLIIVAVKLYFQPLVNEVNTNTSTYQPTTPVTPSTGNGNTVPSTTTPSTTTPSTTTENTMVIGSDEYGYLTLPGKWYTFYDVSGTKSGLQYTKDSIWIVSIDSMEKTTTISAESLAKTALYNMKYGDEKVENATGATVKVGSYTAYQVYGYYPNDNIWLVEWFFEPGDGKVHYISVEGNDRTSDYFKIPDSFKLKK